MDLETYATGFNSPPDWRCRKTAPTPYDDASAESVVSNFGSNNARTGVVINICLTSLNARCCAFPHIHWTGEEPVASVIKHRTKSSTIDDIYTFLAEGGHGFIRVEEGKLFVNHYSHFIEVARLNRTTAEEVIRHTKSIFTRHGIPEVVISDNDPQYSVDAYEQFAKEY